MKFKRNFRAAKQRGFSLLELLLVIAILSLIVGAVFSQMSDAQRRLNAEETKLGDFQEARDFVDQFFRDINQAGTPNIRMFDPTQTFSPILTTQTAYSWANKYVNDSRFAVGLVKIDTATLMFEGSVNGTGAVQSMIYQVNGSGSCSLCLQRSQVDKVNGTPLPTSTTGGAQGQDWGTEINDVILSNTNSTPIFRYFQYDGTEITATSSPNSLPADISTAAGAQTIANVKTIQINLTIRNNNIIDQKTGLPIETSFEGEISLNNCSMASIGQPMSCQ
jgi:prepilin-type N-terminal cleavage/methylation domain-containing protein